MQMEDIPVGHVARSRQDGHLRLRGGTHAVRLDFTGGVFKVREYRHDYEDLGPFSEVFARTDNKAAPATGQPVRLNEKDEPIYKIGNNEFDAGHRCVRIIDSCDHECVRIEADDIDEAVRVLNELKSGGEAITQQILGARSELLPRWIRTSQGLFQTRNPWPRFVYGEGTSLELVVDGGPTHSDIFAIAEGEEAERLLDTLAERLRALNVRAAQVTDENGRPTVPITNIGRYRCRDGMMATIEGRIHDGNPFPWQGVRENGCRNIWNSNGLSPVGFCDVVEYVGPCERNAVRKT